MSSTIFLGADHAGFALKEKIAPLLRRRDGNVIDLSPAFHTGDDYPKIAARVARHVAKTKDARGVLVCGSGVGVVIAANRISGVRAFDASDANTTRLAREHTDANVIAFSGWRQSARDAAKLLDLFLTTKFSTATRHQRRIKQLK